MSCVTSLVDRSIVLCIASTIAFGVYTIGAAAQTSSPAGQPAAPPKEAAPWTDPLGRSTPRGTVMGFLDAARAGDDTRAAQYLNASGQRAKTLARDLFVVLDARLPARLMRISAEPEGSGTNPSALDKEVIGTIDGREGQLQVVLERLARGQPGPIWLFSKSTLDSVPELYDEVLSARQQAFVPGVLINTRVAGVRLLDLGAVLVGLPLIYFTARRLNRLLAAVIGFVWHLDTNESHGIAKAVLSAPARLLLVTVAGTWLVSTLPLSLAVRQLWSGAASLVTIAAVAWLLIRLNAEIERYIQRRSPPSRAAATASLLRLVRWGVDLMILIGTVIVILRHFGIDPTPALAGLGVGGIAVALAAQKTLENVIAGASLIFDQAVRVGDFLKMDTVVGTIDHIGLRSTRIRTLDRTLVSVPNSQIANVSLETLSARDKFWFNHIVGLRYETTPGQLRGVVDGVRQLLAAHAFIDAESVRVRFVRLGAFSLDVEVFAYLLARDWNHFLELQEELLFDVTEIVSRSGTAIAFPSQTMYVANSPADADAARPLTAAAH